MIIKVVDGRRDGRSSFKRLSEYLTEGIFQSGEAPTKTSWERLTQYITAESVLNALGDNVDKTIAVELGNLNSLKTAAVEMQAVAAQNNRQKDPVLHYVLSWPENERPATPDILGAARHTLKALGLEEHQYIVAIHANTDNIHAHVEVNRIHPQTYLATRIEWMHKTLHRAARECEIQYGWSHDSGLFNVIEVNGEKHVVANDSYVDPDLVSPKRGANLFETWTGEQSLETWCKGEPAKELKQVLDDPKTTSWQDVHRVLARHGLELRDSGGGGMKVFDVSEKDMDAKQEQTLVVPASKAFRFMKRNDLEKRFGSFEARDPNLNLDPPTRTYKRDPQKRLERRLERKEIRDALHQRYKEETKKIRTLRTLAQQQFRKTFPQGERERFATLSAAYLENRQAIRKDDKLTSKEKQQAYMLAKLTMLQALEQLKQQIRLERHERQKSLPTVPSWRLWVEQQAQLGDEAAISALRGMIYQEGRNEKLKAKRTEEEARENAIVAANTITPTDPYVRAMQGLMWKVGKNGRVAYSFKNGDPAFYDEGTKLTFRREQVTDDALRVTLLYAADKWTREVRINGSDPVFKARAVRMAVELGLTVKNQELRDLQKNIHEELAHVRKKMTLMTPETTTLGKAANFNIEERLIERNPKAIISHAITQNQSYTGKIVMRNDRYLAQQTARTQYVLHEKSAFPDTLPVNGRNTLISYQSGQARHEVPKKKDRSRK